MTKKENERLVILETKLESEQEINRREHNELKHMTQQILDKLDGINIKDGKQNSRIDIIESKIKTHDKFIWAILIVLVGAIIKSFIG